MTLSENLITEIIENSTLSYNGVDTDSFTEEVDEESFSSEDNELMVKIGALEYTFIFEVYHTWSSVNSGGNGWDDENYDYPENEETEITLSAIYDDEGDDIEFEGKEFYGIVSKLETFIGDQIFETVKK